MYNLSLGGRSASNQIIIVATEVMAVTAAQD
jgi:hypothetical protein